MSTLLVVDRGVKREIISTAEKQAQPSPKIAKRTWSFSFRLAEIFILVYDWLEVKFMRISVVVCIDMLS
jgi:hypothetical protein